MRKLRKVVLVAGVAAMTLSLAVPANALSNKNKLKFSVVTVGTGSASAGWQSGSDSPADGPNSQRIKLTVNSIDQFNYGYALAFNNNAGINWQGVSVGNVKNLSFDFMNASPGTGYVGAGAPRISVDIDTGGSPAAEASAFLAGSYCNTPYASPNDDWSRADFTGQTAVGCTLFFQNVAYSSDGVNSAWAVFAAANPTYIARSAYVVMDETGTAYLDRLAIQNKMFVAPSKTANCPTEVSC